MSTWTILAPQILHPVPLQYWLKWPNPIHPQSSLPDLIGEQNGVADCPCEDDEEIPPLEGDDATELWIFKEAEH